MSTKSPRGTMAAADIMIKYNMSCSKIIAIRNRTQSIYWEKTYFPPLCPVPLSI